MRNILSRLLAGLLFVLGTVGASAQVTVTNPGNTTPGLAATYGSLAAAITDLNLQTVISGPVTITLDAANPQTSPAGGYVINTTMTGGSLTNTVTIEGSSNTITAPTTHTVGVLTDAIFKILGTDFITIQGFTMLENGANAVTTAGSNNMTEFGVALFYLTTTNGAQNITIQNNTITLNRTYANTFGIYANATHTSTAVTTTASATTTAGGNNSLKIYTNNISNVNMGITVVGPTAPADYNNGVDIGGVGAGTGNTITNFGTTGTFSGYANVSGTVNGILVRNSTTINVSYNSVTSSSGAAGVTAGTVRGIFIPAASTQPTGTYTNSFNNNTLAITSHVLAGTINGILVESTTSTPTSTTNINNNNFTTLNHTIAAATGAITAISQSGSATAGPLNSSINSNTFTNITSSSAGAFVFISNNFARPANGVSNANSNSIATGFNRTGASGAVTFYNSNSLSPTTASETNTGNNFSNITLAGTSSIAGWVCTDGSTSAPFGSGKTVTNNTFSGITGGSGTIIVLTVAYSNSGSATNHVSGNIVSNVTGSGAITGITSLTSSQNFFNNTVSSLSGTGASAVTGMSITGGNVQNLYKNKIYDLQSNNAGGTTFGITLSGGTASMVNNVYNNLVGDLRAIASSATDAVRGINITGLPTTGTFNIYYNTIYLNATSSGANFGTTGLFHTTSTTAATGALNMRNNIIVNLSTAAGTGFTVAYRRSSTTLTNYVSTSNNNLLYAGATASPNFIYHDGTAGIQMAAYKTLVSPRETASVTETVSSTPGVFFQSLSGGSSVFLHLVNGLSTQAESGAAPIATFTDDYDGDTRNVTTPDIGADEFAGVAADLTGPNISYTPLGNTCSTTGVTLTATITDASGVPTAGIGLPVLYWNINGGGYSAATGVSIGANQYQFTFGSGVVVTNTVAYYIVAQDNAGTPNISASPSGGAGGFTANPPAAATPPTTPSSFTIQASLSGTYTVGGGGTYGTITAAVSAYNTSCLTGPVVFSLLDATYPTETYPIVINANTFANATNTLTIKPATGVSPNITTALVSNYMFRVLGNYVIFDGSNTVGGTTRDMTISNTAATAPSAILYASVNPTPNIGGTIKN
ncbi:MAG TPA: hypothetical protein VK489_13910, partial [Ferruginibacter sp.]|nr:hypothetical protein [Ferruginibacter sp.]